jgi:hypothetical protein
MRIVTMPIDAERHGVTEAIAMNQGIKIEFIGRSACFPARRA